jgi:N-acetylneuraminic acid mutarotase
MEWQDKSALPNPSTVPQPRQSFTGTCVNGKIVYIGGQTSVRVRFDDVYVFDPGKHGKKKKKNPKNSEFIFSSEFSNNYAHEKTHQKTKKKTLKLLSFSTATRTFSKPPIRGNPPKFARHSAVAIGDKIYIFGGYDGFGSFFGLAVLDTVNWTWEYPKVNGNSPIPRTNHAVTAIGSKMYLFGGNDTTSPEKDKLRCGTYDDFVLFDTGSPKRKKRNRKQINNVLSFFLQRR